MLLDLIERVWDSRHRKSHELLWEWKYGLKASSLDDTKVAQVVERGSDILGYAGAIPVRYKAGELSVKGSTRMDLFTSPDARGTGVSLFKHVLLNCTIEVGAANPRSAALFRRLSKLDSITIKDAVKFVYVFEPARFLLQRKIPTFLIRPLTILWRARNWSCRLPVLSSSSATHTRLERVDHFPPAVEGLCQDFANDYEYIIIRDQSYLNWRFCECPIKYEKWLLWSGGQLVGYVVYRPARMKQRKILLLIEIIAVRKQIDYYHIMLSHLHQVGRALRVTDIQTLDPGCPILSKALRQQGYIRKEKQTPIIGYTNLDLDIYEGRNWYLSSGDADFEFILFSQYTEDLST